MESVVSQNSLYVVENTSAYEVIVMESSHDYQLLINDTQFTGVYSLQPLSNGKLVEENCEALTFSQKLALTMHDVDSNFIRALLALTINQTLVITNAKQHLDVNIIELRYSVPLSSTQHQALTTLCNQYQVDCNDINSLPSLNKPGLVVLDMDSTSITIECIDEIAKLADVGEQVAEITELAMQGKLDFSQSLRERVSKLEGIEVSLLDSIANNLPLMPGMKELSAVFKQYQWRVAIASGGFTYFADNLKELLKLDAAVSNTLVIKDGKLTGEVAGIIVDAQVKADTVEALALKYGIEPTQTIAIGDGANDLKMMDKAALGIAFHAKPLVQEKADIAINHGDLRSVITLLLH